MKTVEVRASATTVLYRRTDDEDDEISADHKEEIVAVRMLTERDIEKDEGDDVKQMKRRRGEADSEEKIR